jgi:hypothetical protein
MQLPSDQMKKNRDDDQARRRDYATFGREACQGPRTLHFIISHHVIAGEAKMNALSYSY